MTAESNILDNDQDLVQLDEAADAADVEDVVVDSETANELPADLAEMIETDEDVETSEGELAAAAVAPAVPGKRMSLKEKLAARRASEQGQDTTDVEGKWYVLHTYSGYENKVKKSIETRVESLDLGDRVYEIVVPTQEEIEIKN